MSNQPLPPGLSKGPFTLAILAAICAAISSAISNRPCKLLAIPRRSGSPVVYMGDLKSPRNHAWNRSKNRQCKRAIMPAHPEWRWVWTQLRVSNEGYIRWSSLSINALCACVYIDIQQVSSFRAPTLWFIDLTVATCHIQYTFLSLCQFFSRENGQNTKILSYDTKMAADSY